MKLRDYAVIGITSVLLATALPNKALSQIPDNITGHINSLYGSQDPISLVDVTHSNFGSGISDEDGYYAIGDTTTNVVEFPYVITPSKTSKVDIFNILGQKVKSLENIVDGSGLDLGNVAQAIYIVRSYDDKGRIIGDSKVSNINGNVPILSVPNKIVINYENNKNNGREISDDNYFEMRFNHPDFWERVVEVSDTTSVYDESLISGDDTFLEHMNLVLWRTETYGSVRWPNNVDPVFTIWPYFINTLNPLGQANIDNIIQAIDSVAHYSEELFNGNITGQYEIVDELPPAQTPGIIRIYGKSSIPFLTAFGASYNTDHEVYYCSIQLKHDDVGASALFDEIFKSVTVSISDSNILIPSIYNTSTGAGGQLYDADKKIIKANNSRAVNWKAPDKTTF